MTHPESTELTVQGESLQRLYNLYYRDSFAVNRRYQRKLVWRVDEKEKLIDSVAKRLPIPLVLLAESTAEGHDGFEIIDGLQRLNAIFSFLENDFSYDGYYFDLESLADTKYLRDLGKIQQKTPILDRESCLRISNYQLPVSTYRSATEQSVDEVFRRINSSGQKLSLQDIRHAGTTTELASLVRRLSSAIRGDASLSDIVLLKDMPKISITDKESDYGIHDTEIFWVKQGILPRDAMRESRDEELVLDILLDIIINPLVGSGTEYRNAAYGRDGAAVASIDTIEAKIRQIGPSTIEANFIETLDVIRQTIDLSGTTWSTWTITQTNPRGIPRYFHAVFLAVYELMHARSMELRDAQLLTTTLKGFWDRELSIPGGGGSWGANRKRPLFDAIEALLKGSFKKRNDLVTRRRRESSTQFEIELQMALTESALFELKQGFLTVDDNPRLDDGSLDKILRTASAMANTAPSARGYIFIGVADTIEDAQRIEEFRSISSLPVGSFFITGTNHELSILGRSVDEHLRWLTDRIRNSKLDTQFAQSLAASLVVFEYHGYIIWSLAPRAEALPVSWDGRFYTRSGNSTLLLEGNGVTDLVVRFMSATAGVLSPAAPNAAG